MNDFNQNSHNNPLDSENNNDSSDVQPQTTNNDQQATTIPESNGGKEKTMGSTVAVIIIIIVLIIGGLYYWGKTINNLDSNKNTVDQNLTAEDIASQPDASLNKLKNQGTSDKPADIEADLGATDLNGLDAGIGNINAELGI